MRCPNCNNEVNDGAAFCIHCGKPLPKMKTCPNCGALIAESVAFCTNCGIKQPELQKRGKKTTSTYNIDYHKAELCYNKKEYVEAQRLVEEALKAEPENKEYKELADRINVEIANIELATLEKAKTLLAKGEYETAYKVGKELIQTYEKEEYKQFTQAVLDRWQDDKFELAKKLLDTKQYGSSIDIIDKALSLGKRVDLEELREKVVEAQREDLYSAAKSLFNEGRYEEAYKSIDDLYNTYKRDEFKQFKQEVLEKWQSDLSEKVQQLCEKTRYEDAIEIIDKALSVKNSDVFGELKSKVTDAWYGDLYSSAKQCIQRGNLDAAINQLRQACNLKPDNEEVKALLKNTEHTWMKKQNKRKVLIISACLVPIVVLFIFIFIDLITEKKEEQQQRIQQEQMLLMEDEAKSVNATSAETTNEASTNGKRSFQDYKVLKKFVNDEGEYYDVEIEIAWPESIGGGDVRPLQSAIMNKAFGLIRSNIDDALSAYLSTFGKEIDELPEWSMEINLYNIILIVEEKEYIKNRYTAFSIYTSRSMEGSSPHAAERIYKFVNYDIQKQRELTISDILTPDVSHQEILEQIKAHADNWDDVKNPEELPQECLLTDRAIEFPFLSWQSGIALLGLGSRCQYISDDVKKLLLDN